MFWRWIPRLLQPAENIPRVIPFLRIAVRHDSFSFAPLAVGPLQKHCMPQLLVRRHDFDRLLFMLFEFKYNNNVWARALFFSFLLLYNGGM